MSSRIPFRSIGIVALATLGLVGCRPQPVEVSVEAPAELPATNPAMPPAASQGSLVTPEDSSQKTEAEPLSPNAPVADSSVSTTEDVDVAMAPVEVGDDPATDDDGTTTPEQEGGPLTAAELEEEYVPDPEILAELEAQRVALRKLADTYDPPPQAKQLGKEADLWVDLKSKRVYIDGYVSMKRGPLEMLACPVGTKEHESVVALFAKSSDVHAALLAVGAKSGTTARWDPEFLPPTGQTILVWVAYRDPKPTPKTEGEPTPQPFVPDDEFKFVDARKWIRRIETKEELSEPWVFSGSNFWTDPEEGTEYYSANGGDMICVSNFSTAMMDVPFDSSADAGNVLFEPFSERIPTRGTPVRLVLVPQPTTDASSPDDEPSPASEAAAQPPTDSILPLSN